MDANFRESIIEGWAGLSSGRRNSPLRMTKPTIGIDETREIEFSTKGMKPYISIIPTAFFLLASNLIAGAERAPSVNETADTIEIAIGGSPVLTYHKAVVQPPPGADPAFARSGFIHPVHSPSGAVVTGIHPDDHIHHLGLWHAWVKCEVDGEAVDFWNLKAKTGAIRFAKTIKLISDPKSAGFTVSQEHIIFPGNPQKETVILSEELTVIARLVDDAYEIDYQTRQTNVSKHSLKLPAYRYGGPIAYRAPHHWNKTNSDYLSSEGKTRLDGHTTRSKWIAMWGPSESSSGHDTLSILNHSGNHDFPQHMRVWPPETNNGAIFFNYVPIQETGWEIKPEDSSTMRYRIVVENGKPDPTTLEQRWTRFAR